MVASASKLILFFYRSVCGHTAPRLLCSANSTSNSSTLRIVCTKISFVSTICIVNSSIMLYSFFLSSSSITTPFFLKEKTPVDGATREVTKGGNRPGFFQTRQHRVKKW